jgi:hypoxanthine phosphoribosyltransferase
MHKPASLEVCTLFSKHKLRLIDLKLKYIGFELPDRFVVGYGLDHRERYRNLPFVGLLKPQVLRIK